MPTTQESVPIKEYFDAVLAERDKALQAALASVKEENRKTEAAAEKRFELLNELRSGVATKDQLIALEKAVDELKTYKTIAETKASSWLVWIGLFFTGAAFFISIYNAFLK